MSLKQDKGHVLITSLLPLLVMTIIGIAAIETSTFENILSGNIRLRETNLSTADAGSEISTAVIERVVREQDTKGFTDLIKDSDLATELRTTAFSTDSLDVGFDTGTQTVSVDIDKMYAKWIGGTAMEFASGYEGIGKSGSSGFYAFYRINSTSTGMMTSEAVVGAIYRYVPK